MNHALNSDFSRQFATTFGSMFEHARSLYNKAMASAVGGSTLKRDGSVVTSLDRELGSFFKSRLLEAFPGCAVVSEDQVAPTAGEQHATRNPKIIFLVDPIDGSRPFSIGAATSTMIVSAVNPNNKKIVSAQIGDLATGRVVYLEGGEVFLKASGVNSGESIKVATSKAPLSANSSLFLDCARGFRDVISDTNASQILYALNQLGKLAMLGSNGQHHMLVAMGRGEAVGGLTMAVGGPWDLGGAALIIAAGGSCKALRIKQGKIIKSDCDPLNPFGYNALIYANNNVTVEALFAALSNALATNA